MLSVVLEMRASKSASTQASNSHTCLTSEAFTKIYPAITTSSFWCGQIPVWSSSIPSSFFLTLITKLRLSVATLSAIRAAVRAPHSKETLMSCLRPTIRTELELLQAPQVAYHGPCYFSIHLACPWVIQIVTHADLTELGETSEDVDKSFRLNTRII